MHYTTRILEEKCGPEERKFETEKLPKNTPGVDLKHGVAEG
jgi:hypothetical protein